MREPKKKRSNRTASGEFNLYKTGFNYKRVSKAKRRVEPKLSVRESFFIEFAEEIDLLSSDVSFPDWVFRFRDELLGRIGYNMRRLCRKLKDMGVGFYIFYPVEIDGSWKFADVFIPKLGLVVLLASFDVSMFSPCNVKSAREYWFSRKFDVVCIFPDELSSLGEKIEKAHPILTDKVGYGIL